MGAAKSTNSAEAITNVSNFVKNSTEVNANAVNSVRQNINLTGCGLMADNVNIEATSKLMQTNNQIVKAKQDSKLMNNIQQQIMQQAQATVGSLGMGFANSHNSTSVMVNNSNQIINAMTVGCSQFSSVDQTFDCQDSKITAKNVNISLGSDANFINSQTLGNEQIASITNDITQVVDQKATATVEGMTGFLFMLLLALGVLVYTIMKPLSSGSAKIIVAVILCFVFVMIIIGMYLRETPPFFGKLNECINNSSVGRTALNGTELVVHECVDFRDGKITLSSPPLRYVYGISPFDSSQPGGNLVQMAIAANSGQTEGSGAGINGGYRGDTYDTLARKLQAYIPYAQQLGVPMVPNPLVLPSKQQSNVTLYYLIPGEYSRGHSGEGTNSVCTPGTISVGSDSDIASFATCPSIARPSAFATISESATLNDKSQVVANLNSGDWFDYLNVTGKYPGDNTADERRRRSLFARFVLCDIIGNIDLHFYVDNDELVKYRDSNNIVQVAFAKDVTDTENIYKYHPYNYPSSFDNGFVGPGYIIGKVGFTDDNNYRFQRFMRNIGGYIMIAIIGLIFILMAVIWWINRKTKPEGKPENK